MILIIIKFPFTLSSLRILNAMRSYIKHKEECFIRDSNTSKLVKKTRLRLDFSNHFSVFGYLIFFLLFVILRLNPFPFERVLGALIDFTLSNARRFYSSMGNLSDGKGLTTSKTMSLLTPSRSNECSGHL